MQSHIMSVARYPLPPFLSLPLAAARGGVLAALAGGPETSVYSVNHVYSVNDVVLAFGSGERRGTGLPCRAPMARGSSGSSAGRC